MSGNDNRCVREMTLQEEILDLKNYNVPDHIIERIYRKVEEQELYNTRMHEVRRKEIQIAVEHNQNLGAVVNALGAYLYQKDSKEWV